MARLSRLDVGSGSYSSSYSSSSYSYSTAYISIEEALKRVISGEMVSDVFFSQAPKQLQELLNEIGTTLFKSNFQNLSNKKRKKVCEALLNLQKPIEDLLQQIADGKMAGELFYNLASQDLRDALNRAGREMYKTDFVSLWKRKQRKVCQYLLSPRSLSLYEVLEALVRGDIEGQTFYNQTSSEVRDVLDNISQTAFQKTFSKLSKKEQSEVCGILLNVVPAVDSNTHSRNGIVQRIKNFIGWS